MGVCLGGSARGQELEDGWALPTSLIKHSACAPAPNSTLAGLRQTEPICARTVFYSARPEPLPTGTPAQADSQFIHNGSRLARVLL